MSSRHSVYSKAKAAARASSKLLETPTDEAALLGMPVSVAPPGRTPVPEGEEAPVVTEGGGATTSVGAKAGGAAGAEPASVGAAAGGALASLPEPEPELGLGLGLP